MSSRHHGVTIAVTLALFAALSVLGGSAEARGESHGGGEHGGGGFGDRGHMGAEHVGGVRGDGDRASGFDRDRWNGGHWFRGEHLGREGWWWIVGDDWYGYDDPVYPSPDPYVPTSAAAGYWYYCGSARAYYPYVAACPEGWTPVAPQ
jgi:hypothetical protein